MGARRPRLATVPLAIPDPDRSPLYDVRNPAGVSFQGLRMRSVVSRGRRFCRDGPTALDSIWWSQTGSNRRPHACKARALPAELWPRTRRRMLSLIKVVGLGRLELPTSRLSSARSNQLSYKPLTRGASHARAPAMTPDPHKPQPEARVRPRRKRNEDGEIPPMQLNGPDDHWPLMFLKRSDRDRRKRL